MLEAQVYRRRRRNLNGNATAGTIACGRSEAHREEMSPSGWGRVVGGEGVRRNLPRARHASVFFAHTPHHKPSFPSLIAGTRYIASGAKLGPVGLVPRISHPPKT